jgi:hypothetical protein
VILYNFYIFFSLETTPLSETKDDPLLKLTEHADLLLKRVAGLQLVQRAQVQHGVPLHTALSSQVQELSRELYKSWSLALQLRGWGFNSFFFVHRVCTHKVTTAAFWRTFHHYGKLAQPGESGGVRTRPTLFLYLPSCTKLQCTLQLSGRYTHHISSLLIYVLYAFVSQQNVFFHTQNLNREVEGHSLAVTV